MLLLPILALQVSVLSDKPPRRIEVTPQHLATAFHDAEARTLFERARSARKQQDSSLRSYDATVRARSNFGVTMGENGRERALYRTESASRVQWQHDIGAYVTLSGARVGIPVAPVAAERSSLIENLVDGAYSVVPYFAGHETLWIGSAVGSNQIDDRGIVNPLADGAEAYYTYESGDSVGYTLPDGAIIRLRELKVRPRTASWNVAVGSLQFDVASGQLVAAIYRFAAPQDVLTSIGNAIDDTAKNARLGLAIVKAVAPTIESRFGEVKIEYALHESRFWLPRIRTWKGSVDVASISMPATVQQVVSYAEVNGRDTLPPIVLNAPDRGPVRAPDSLSADAAKKWRDSVLRGRTSGDSVWKANIRSATCGSTGMHTIARYRAVSDLAVAVTFPCELEKLTNSADLPKSLYSQDDSLFTHRNLDELAQRALGLGAQAAFSLMARPRWRYGLSMTRYNRVEGFSTGLGIDQQLGGGFVAAISARIGTGDAEPYGELSLARTNLAKTITLGGYHRLVSANDWGSPLSFNSSLSAFFFGRDEGFYYRASGADLTYKRTGTIRSTLRLFAEQHHNANQETDFSVGGNFVPNIRSASVSSVGASLRLVHDYGRDPRGFRAFTEVRFEGAGGDSAYGRGAIDVTLSRDLFARIVAGLTLAGGSSVGGVPTQRYWYLGGTHTIRGLRPDTAQSGNAFWMARAEIGKDLRVVRPSIFADLGWAGDRNMKLRDIGRPLSGAGIGLSYLDGLVRLDLSRGIYPTKQFRLDLSVGAKW